jgi:hypothetical protein
MSGDSEGNNETPESAQPGEPTRIQIQHLVNIHEYTCGALLLWLIPSVLITKKNISKEMKRALL